MDVLDKISITNEWVEGHAMVTDKLFGSFYLQEEQLVGTAKYEELSSRVDQLEARIKDLTARPVRHMPTFSRVEAGSRVLDGFGIHIKAGLVQGNLRSILFICLKGSPRLRWDQGDEILLKPGEVRGLKKSFPSDLLGDFVLTLADGDKVETFWSAELPL